MAQKLNKETVEELTEAFNVFDKDRDGKITTKELGPLLRSIGHNLTTKELKKMTKLVDANGKGTVELSAFLNEMAKRMQPLTEDIELSEAFRAFDRDGNGLITADEIKHVMTTLGENLSDAEVTEMIRTADLNGDGMVNYQEFARMIGTKLGTK